MGFNLSQQKPLTWLRVAIRDKTSPVEFRGSLGMLTGQDTRALKAIAECWNLYASSDDDGAHGSLAAIRALLPAMQSKCRPFARELIAWAMNWEDRDRLWPLVTQSGDLRHVVSVPNVEPVRKDVCTKLTFEARGTEVGTPCVRCGRPLWEHP